MAEREEINVDSPTTSQQDEQPSDLYWRQVALGGTGAARRHARSLRARAAIVDAAGAQFAERGYVTASLSEIAAASGFTKGSLYFHFRSKEELAREVINTMLERWLDMRAEVATRSHDPLRTLVSEVDEVIARSMQDPVIRGGVRLAYDPDLTADTRSHFLFGERAVVELLEQAARQELLREGVDISLVARQIIALMCGHRVLQAIEKKPGSMHVGMRDAWRILLPAIASSHWVESVGNRLMLLS